MFKLIRTLLIIELTIFSIHIAYSQENTPQDVLSSMMQAQMQFDYAKAANLIHPDSLVQMKNIYREMIVNDKSNKFVISIFLVNSLSEYDNLAPIEAFIRYTKSAYTMIPNGMKEPIKNYKIEIIGTLFEGKETAFVVYRLKTDNNDTNDQNVNVEILKQYNSIWKIYLKKNTTNMPF